MLKPKLHIDFRPAPRGRWIPPLIAALLLIGCGLVVWLWVAPYDRVARLERALNVLEGPALDAGIRELAALGAPGRRTLITALAHERPEVRQAVRRHWWEALAGWSLRPARRPQEFAALTMRLGEVLPRLPEAELTALRPWIEQWLALDMEPASSLEIVEKNTSAMTQAEDYASARANLNALAHHARTPLPAILNEPTRLVVAPPIKTPLAPTMQATATIETDAPDKIATADYRSEIATAPEPGVIRPIAASGRGGLNEPALLPTAIDAVPTVVDPDANGPPPSAEVLHSSGWFERWKAADRTKRKELVASLERRGMDLNDFELVKAYAADDPSRASAAVEHLPERADVQGDVWLRIFAEHPTPTVRKSAVGWLLTSPDRATHTWLRNRMLRETHAELRAWYHETLAVREKTNRARN